MKAIIPVAGIGTRLQPLTNKIPKVLLNVAGKPMLFHLIDELIGTEKIDKIILIIGYLGKQIVNDVNKHYSDNRSITFEFVEQKEMLGLAHAIYQGKKFIDDEPVLIVLGDTIFEFDLDGMLSSEFSAIGYKDVEDVSRFGIIESDHGFITRMIEKPSGPEVTKSKSAIAGIYFIKEAAKLFKAVEHLMDNDIKTKNEFQLTDALQKMITDGDEFIPFEIINWFDCGKPETLLSTNTYILKRDFSAKRHDVGGDVTIIPPVSIGSHCDIVDSTIGPNVTLTYGCKIKNSSVKNSIIYDNAEVTDAELDEVILGKHEHITGVNMKIVKADKKEVNF